MRLTTRQADPNTVSTGALLLPVQSGDTLPAASAAVDTASGGALSACVRAGDLPATAGSTVCLRNLSGVKAERVLLVRSTADDADYGAVEQGLYNAFQALGKTGARDAVSYLATVAHERLAPSERAHIEVCALHDAAYRFTAHKSAKSPAATLTRVSLAGSDRAHRDAIRRAVTEATALYTGVALARDLGNTPPNVCTPDYLATRARAMAKAHASLQVTVLNEKRMAKLGMGALLAVARGSRNPPRLIALSHNGGAKRDKPVVLVGKGVTFDTGGISIKPSAAMDEMKFDMCGAAAVFGVVQAAAALKLKCNLVGVIGAVENMADGDAYRPGDILTSLSGKTIEVLNTDAEGRLVLADALTWATRYKPAAMIDVATLTGACVVALGRHASAVMGDDVLCTELVLAGRESGDRAWQLPLWDEYKQQLDSLAADVANIGGSPGGAITAGAFLSHFTGGQTWAHMDIAGTAWPHRGKKWASGRPVRLLCRYLQNHCAGGGA
ncbi:MAG: leucyl aminopeptidase [Pseudomonadota bacterium]